MNFPDPPADHDHDNPTLDAPCLGCRCRAIMDALGFIGEHPSIVANLATVGAAMAWYGNPDSHDVALLVADDGTDPTRPPLVVIFRLIVDGEVVAYRFTDLVAAVATTVNRYGDGPLPVGDGHAMIRKMHEHGAIPGDDELEAKVRRLIYGD